MELIVAGRRAHGCIKDLVDDLVSGRHVVDAVLNQWNWIAETSRRLRRFKGRSSARTCWRYWCSVDKVERHAPREFIQDASGFPTLSSQFLTFLGIIFQSHFLSL